MSRLVFAPAHHLARMIRDREVSAFEVLDAYLTEIATHNVKVNAIYTLDEDRARQRAFLADEALFNRASNGRIRSFEAVFRPRLAELRITQRSA
ncbi:MAG: hypothetical protein JO235_22300 [Chroococcidiopsidaceae cyanobacterium CP_BM_RX_35]|nr:hypothetical protein [Chroococcidiopsidaceae cyanobacterium CP_BM_RX_35]